MDPLHALIKAWPNELSQTLEMMTGTAVAVSLEPAESATATLWWENKFNSGPPVRLAVGADKDAWFIAAAAILQAAGINPVEEAEARGTWLEVLEQAANSAARRLGLIGGRPVESGSGREISEPAGQTFRAVVRLDGQSLPVFVVLAADQIHIPAPATASRQQELTESAPAMAVAAGAGAGSALIRPLPVPAASRTMEALLDIQLPVSISFGQARIPLRDVLKLTTGSVVELNRQPEDPVDIIVNDCVIARGEVVVVDGNYAVRIQAIIGRQQRLGLSPDRDSGVL